MSEAKDWLKIARSNLKLGKAYYNINDNEIRFALSFCFTVTSARNYKTDNRNTCAQ